MVYNFSFQKLLDALLPVSCRLCNTATGDHLCLCQQCLAELPRIAHGCSRCALPLAAPGICGRCQEKPAACEQVLALYHYAEPIDFLVQQLKYQRNLQLAVLFAHELANTVTTMANPPDILLPVPLHGSRLRQRGYNQSWEITRRLSHLTGVPTSVSRCRRVRPTVSQTGLNAAARQRNLRRAFSVTEDVSGKHIAIVDDVSTTGATLDELAATLKKHGALRITGLIVARADR